MPLTTSFTGLLKTLSALDNKPERQALTLLMAEVSQQLSDDFQANSRGLNETRVRAEAQMSFVMAMRTLWHITPERLFTAADPNYERLASEALARLSDPSDGTAAVALSRVFRHLRRANQEGRRLISSLDLDRPVHIELLASQNGRCALCRYSFAEHEVEYADAEDEIFEAARAPRDGEVVLEIYRRRPVLDHIIPHFLGGDGAENWQILCASCNSGKGEGLAWIMRRGLLPAARPSEAMRLSASLRHAVLANHQAAAPSFGGELRLFRRDSARLPVFDNLEVRADAA